MKPHNVVDQWMSLLGFRRQTDLAAAVKRSKATVSEWRGANSIPPGATLDLKELAQSQSIAVPDHLVRRYAPIVSGIES